MQGQIENTVKTPTPAKVSEMPKNCPEQLAAMDVPSSIPLGEFSRQTWANAIVRYTKDEVDKQFSIRTDRKTQELRVWRLK